MEITYHGITRDHREWAEFCGVSEQTMRWRLAHWDVERALSTPRVSVQNRAPRRGCGLSETDQALACSAYIEGRSEDAIAGLLNVSRRQVSRVLIERGLKIPGSAPERTVSVSITDDGINISIRTDN